MRDHNPNVIEEFNGLWKRGDSDSVPFDHFSDCNNIQFIESGFETRDGLDVLIAMGNVVRLYNYKLQTGESLIGLDTNGNFKHALLDGSGTIYTILTIPEATDFNFIAINGRAYITPFSTHTNPNGENYQKGLENDFLYVYKGDGSAARKAAGEPPTNDGDKPLVAYNSQIDGKIEPNVHVFAVVFTGGADRSSALGPEVLPSILAPGGKEAYINNIPLGGGGITGREIYATKAIDPKDYNPNSLPTFFLVKAITNNTETNTTVSFTDAELTVPFAAGTLAVPSDNGAMRVANTMTDGFCDFGLHGIAVVYETDTGFLTAPGPEVFAFQTFVDIKKAVTVTNIPVSPDSFVTKRHLVATKVINNYNGDQTGYQLFFIPEGTIENNTDTTKTVSFYDLDLLEDASYLIDNFSEIPAGVSLTTYHGRLVLGATFNDISIFYLSAEGEPEAIDQVDGILIIPLDGNPVTNGQEFRDVFYGFKKTRTMAWVDNGDVPSTWKGVWIDQGIGASIHGIATVLDSGGVNVDFLLIVDWSGIMIFNGAYARPELTWKIQDLWFDLERNDFANIQIMNDSLTQMLYLTLPDKKMLWGDYKNGLDPKSIRWSPESFDIETTTITLIDTNTLVIGSEQVL